LRIAFVTLDQALEIHRKRSQFLAELARRATPRLRDPATMPDLLSDQLISGMITGTEDT
jgi:allophanate hydrolase